MIGQSEPRTDRSYGEFEVLPWMMIWLFQWLSVPFYPEAILQNRALLPLALFATAAWYKPAVSIELLKKYFIGDSNSSYPMVRFLPVIWVFSFTFGGLFLSRSAFRANAAILRWYIADISSLKDHLVLITVYGTIMQSVLLWLTKIFNSPIFLKLGFKVLDIGDSARIFSVVLIRFSNDLSVSTNQISDRACLSELRIKSFRNQT